MRRAECRVVHCGQSESYGFVEESEYHTHWIRQGVGVILLFNNRDRSRQSLSSCMRQGKAW